MLIATALLAVYIVLGILYESLVHPLTIISMAKRDSSVPSSPPTGSEAFQAANQGWVVANCKSLAVARGVTRSWLERPEPS